VGEDAKVSEPTPELSTGQVFAGWRVERELARGGMGVIYLAHHPRLPRTDVIKVLSPTLTADPRFRERFLREAERMSTLSHPHVMPIHDSGESEDGTLYLVMPFISGGDLRELLKRHGRLEPARAVRLVAQLGAALDAAHRIGVVHRDVKPENVMLSSVEPDESDHVLLTDFGISREQLATNSLTATGELLLTPAYAAPEQVLGKVTGGAADQYALACILYELLTGEPYADAVPVVMLMAHIQEPVPRIGGRFGIPAAIDDVLARALAKQPERRYASCREFAKAAAEALHAPVETATAVLQPVAVNPPPPQRQQPQYPQQQEPQYPLQPQQQNPQQQYPQPQYAQQQPLHPTQPTQGPKKRRWLIWAAAVVLLAAPGGVAAVVASGGGSTKPTADYTALLQRVPTAVRTGCTDTTKQLDAAELPYVISRATCTHTIGSRDLTVAYRSLRNNETMIKKYRGDVLQLGGTYSSAGNCQTLTSSDPTGTQGPKGFSQGVAQVITGSVWCNLDGSLWFLQLNTTPGHQPVMTELHSSVGAAKADAPQRYADLEAIAPTP
jgi:serine/threonine protein kinase